MHPKKIAKSLPGFAVPDILNSDYVQDHVIGQLHGIAHDAVINGINAMDLFHTLH